jgi:hypothetical protein
MGSGGGPGGRSKATTGSMLRLDVRHVVRELPAVWAGSWGWSWGEDGKATIGLALRMEPSEGAGLLLLDYTRGGEPVSQRIRLEATPCHYGGQRWWARCEGCSRRVAVLWGSRWACRLCHGLAYRTSQLARSDRLTAKARRLQARLGGDGGRELFWPPDKPRGMHWRTYQRLALELEAAEMRQFAVIAARWPQFRGGWGLPAP